MANWIQLKDGVAFACISAEGFVENSILLDASLTPSNVMAKKYDNGSWVDAPLVYFVEEEWNGKVLRVNSTVFSSDVTGPICTSDVKPFWTINNDGTFSPPPTITEATIYDENLFDAPAEEPVTE
jgi:hypothetical protein